ncbi:hypothetical protein GLOIN_2v1642646, partial [Rhizophagus irregularis DAOM 181602=DAOM 197198]
VIDHFTVKSNLDFTDDPEEQNEDNPSNSETNQINESDAQAILAEVSKIKTCNQVGVRTVSLSIFWE